MAFKRAELFSRSFYKPILKQPVRHSSGLLLFRPVPFGLPPYSLIQGGWIFRFLAWNQ